MSKYNKLYFYKYHPVKPYQASVRELPRPHLVWSFLGGGWLHIPAGGEGFHRPAGGSALSLGETIWSSHKQG